VKRGGVAFLYGERGAGRESDTSLPPAPLSPTDRSPSLYRIANIQQNLEVQLLAPVGEVEGSHLAVVASGLCALEGLAVHVVEVGEDAITGAGHAGSLDGSGREARRVGFRLSVVGLTIDGIEQVASSCPEQEASRVERIRHVKREEIFARDANRCVYCGQCYPVDELTVDHIQPRVRGGDRSGGNLVTACKACNTLKGQRRLADFLRESRTAYENFQRFATHVWPRHLKALNDEIDR
jgi:hypothetical protein